MEPGKVQKLPDGIERACQERAAAVATRGDGVDFPCNLMRTAGNRIILEVNYLDDDAPFWPNACFQLTLPTGDNPQCAYMSILTCYRFERYAKWSLIAEVQAAGSGCRRKSPRIVPNGEEVAAIIEIAQTHSVGHLVDFSVDGALVYLDENLRHEFRIGEIVGLIVTARNVRADLQAIVVRTENSFVAVAFHKEITETSEGARSQLDLLRRTLEINSDRTKAS